MWTETVKDFGQVQEGSKLSHTFKYNGPKRIRNVSSDCGCTVTSFNKHTVHVKYNPKDVPNHLIKRGNFKYTTRKTIKVQFTDNSSDHLALKAIVIHEPTQEEIDNAKPRVKISNIEVKTNNE